MKNVRPGPHPSVGCRGVRLTMLQGPSGHQVSTWKPRRASGRMPIRSTPQRGGLLLGFNPCGAGRASKGARPVERDAGGPRSPMRFAIAQPPWNLPDIPPDLVADDFASILRRGHDAVPAHPLRARRAVGPPGHMPPPPFCIGSPTARAIASVRQRGGFAKRVAIHPHSGWFSAPRCARHGLKPLKQKAPPHLRGSRKRIASLRLFDYSSESSSGTMRFKKKHTRNATTRELPNTFWASWGMNCRMVGAPAIPTPRAKEMPTIMRLR